MNKFFTLLAYLMCLSAFGQNNESTLHELSYENKVAEKACLCISKLDTIPDARQAVINCNIQATNEVHEEDVDGKYKRDYTVEGIRRLNKTVTDLLIENCNLVSIDKGK